VIGTIDDSREMDHGGASAGRGGVGPEEEAGPSLRRRLLEEGWEERFSASGARLDEVAEYYRSLGYDVRVELLGDAAASGTCTQCFTVPGVEGPVGIIFTRVGAAPLLEEDELFDG
jgi:hypothetical protein